MPCTHAKLFTKTLFLVLSCLNFNLTRAFSPDHSILTLNITLKYCLTSLQRMKRLVLRLFHLT